MTARVGRVKSGLFEHPELVLASGPYGKFPSCFWHRLSSPQPVRRERKGAQLRSRPLVRSRDSSFARSGRAQCEMRWWENEWECLGSIMLTELRCTPDLSCEWCGEGRNVREERIASFATEAIDFLCKVETARQNPVDFSMMSMWLCEESCRRWKN